MASMMAEVAYDSVLSETTLSFDYGNKSAAALCPTLGTTNLGECLASVHAGQIVVGMLTTAAIGLAGIPNRSDKIAEQATIEFQAMGGPVISGTSESYIDKGEAESLSGVNMLGHASVFTRDDGLGAGQTFQIQVSGYKDKVKETQTMRAVGVDMLPRDFFAFAIRASFTGTETHLRSMTLYADFDLQRYTDLCLVMPNTAHTNSVIGSGETRTRLPGYVTALIANAINSITGSVGVRLAVRPRKRAKIISANAVIRHDNPRDSRDANKKEE